ncbi:hypothetical protein WA026_022099 [Henosepilachna vigintioctopunctata]|uniref:Nondiscriminating glutamyl-tRNA synthetase EARS2, mitochondrial n=1 Tax=Henosepilachna vigintioctopunctata TaxID=420089 RepID=A0AAW1UBZ6_9CUCU
MKCLYTEMFVRNIVYYRYFVYRFYSSNTVRVRFAPSPTGYLHLGGLRTAFYNFLYAKSKTGKFILRIEDTDQTRLVEGADEQLKKDLLWAGIKIDEGPNIGGSYGPYIQSQRLEIYRDQIEILLGNGAAYKCFCTERRLELLRREAMKNREVPKYDNKCRHLTDQQISERLHKGDPYCIRFKLSSDLNSYQDLVYGNITCEISQLEGDPVILKSDGYPTYHFANVVDDHFMKITHVLRGVEWQISTTKHLLLYRALGWIPPKFAHLPLLLNSDGTKFSKRQSDIKIEHYRNSGIFPLALLNFVVNAGGGFDKDSHQNVKPRIYTVEELASQFDITKLNTHSGKLMPERLLEFNQLELKRRLNNKTEEMHVVKEVQSFLLSHFNNLKNEKESLQVEEENIRSILHWCVNRMKKISDLIEPDLRFIWTIPKCYNLPEEELLLVKDLSEKLADQEYFNKEYLLPFLKSYSKQNNFKFSSLMKTMRYVLSGLKVSSIKLKSLNGFQQLVRLPWFIIY